MFIDTHAHLIFNDFEKNRDQIIDQCLKNNTWMINVGTDYQTSKKAVEIAENYSQGVYAAIGFHPTCYSACWPTYHSNVRCPSDRWSSEDRRISRFRSFPRWTLDIGIRMTKEKMLEMTNWSEKSHPSIKQQNQNFDYQKFKNLAQSKKVIAIGEIGLDYYRITNDESRIKNLQKEIFEKQLELAKELNLPVILHCRKAHNEILRLLAQNDKKKKINNINGVIHCFTGTSKQLQEYLELGFYIGFNGIIFKLNLDEIIKKTPLEKILIETDCPFLTPPNFSEKRNNPLSLKYIVEKIAQIKKVETRHCLISTFQNTKKLFNL